MGWKSGVVTSMTVLGLVIGVNEMLAPKTPEQLDQYRRQQLVEQGSDAVENNRERLRDQLPHDIDAENDRRLVPGEHRPAERNPPRIRIRP